MSETPHSEQPEKGQKVEITEYSDEYKDQVNKFLEQEK